VLGCVCGHTQTRCTSAPQHTRAQVDREGPCVTSVPVFQGRESSGHPTRHQLGAMNAGRFAGPRPATSATFLETWSPVLLAYMVQGWAQQQVTHNSRCHSGFILKYHNTAASFDGFPRWLSLKTPLAQPTYCRCNRWIHTLHTHTARPQHCNHSDTPRKEQALLHVLHQHAGHVLLWLAAQARYKQR
jgi:hypothetical protein